MKRIVSMQDISCIGKCSLTVALPIISAMGIETAVMPTAVLSTHTAFSDFTLRDLTGDIPGIIKCWEKEGFSFDAVYSGYLGSTEQISIVKELFAKFSPGIKFVDPAMADEGDLYKGFDCNFVNEMKELCAEADVIVPNLTEACLLTDKKYSKDADEDYIKEIITRLGERGTGKVIMTGASNSDDQYGAICYDSKLEIFTGYYNSRVDASYHGTGDIFASCLIGALTREMPIHKALKLAVDFTLESIVRTQADPKSNWYGVNFEQALSLLADTVSKK